VFGPWFWLKLADEVRVLPLPKLPPVTVDR